VNWLITGGCGFIGLNLVKNLIEEGGHHIRIVDNLSVGTRKNLAQICNFIEYSEYNERLYKKNDSIYDSVELFIGDIRDYGICLNSCKDIDIIVHLAANTGVGPSIENPRKDMEGNVIGTFNILEAARQNNVKRFIFASSGAAIGECEPPIHEKLAPHPVSPYGASKLAGEAYCSAYFRTFGLETVALRFGNVYGPLSGQKNSVVAKFIKRAMEGKPLEIYGDGNQTRDFIYIDDLTRAIHQVVKLRPLIHDSSILSSSPWGEAFQIATNSETTITDLTEKLLPILEKSGIENVKVRYTDPRIGDVRRNFSDTSKARRILGWQVQTSITEGLNLTVKWFLDNIL